MIVFKNFHDIINNFTRVTGVKSCISVRTIHWKIGNVLKILTTQHICHGFDNTTLNSHFIRLFTNHSTRAIIHL